MSYLCINQQMYVAISIKLNQSAAHKQLEYPSSKKVGSVLDIQSACEINVSFYL
uniref:Uncharacterized protein n=1 Tax=Octopus bimaculoides TaxID=37653 RepID=A0A0L8HCS0_OCTBM